MRLLLCVSAVMLAASATLAHEVRALQQVPNPVLSVTHDGDITQVMEEVETPGSVYATLEACRENPYMATDDIGEAAVVIDQIINLGTKIWAIVEKGKPVTDVQYTYANALPQGVRSAAELESFSPLQARSFRVSAKNGFGITVYDITYTLVHRFGGSFNGKGKYLDSVTVLPSNVDNVWGYTVNLGVTGVSTVNLGTKADPVAGMTMELTLKVSTILKTSEQRSVFDFHGDNARVNAI